MDKDSLNSESSEDTFSSSSFKSWQAKPRSATFLHSRSCSFDSESSEKSLNMSRSRRFTVSDTSDYSFTDNMRSIRSYIKTKFQIMKGRITQLEDKMLDSLQVIEDKYSQRLHDNKISMDKMKSLKTKIGDLVTDNSLQAGINDLIRDKYTAKSGHTEVCVTLQWPRGLETYLNQLDDALKTTTHDYPASPQDSPPPVEVVSLPTLQSFGRMGQGPGDMVSPRSVTISKEGLVYCSDWENNVIMAYTSYGELMYSITNVKSPYGIHAHEDRLYVTEASNSILKVGKMGSHACVKAFDLEGNLMNKVGKYGSGNSQFKSPSGLTAYEVVEGETKVFVCDTDNNRIQIFNSGLQFARLFVAGKVKQPDDVKVQDMRVYVLDKKSPCLHVFTFQEETVANIISHGSGRDLDSSCFFTLSKCGCIVIGDHERNCLKVFTPSGRLVRIIGTPNTKTGEFYMPLGIAQGEDDQMAVVSLRQTGCLQLFRMNLNLFSF